MKPYWEENGISIYHGDCLDIAPELTADCMVTDPPYGMKYQSGWKKSSRVAGDQTTTARDKALGLWGDKPAFVFGRWSVPRPAGTRMLLIWNKGDWPGMGDLKSPWGPSTEEIYVIGRGFIGKRSGQIIHDPKRPNGNSFHPTEKPQGLMRKLIESCPPHWVIIDPFMGSGSTLVACRDLGRKCIGIEMEAKYCDIAIKRLEWKGAA